MPADWMPRDSDELAELLQTFVDQQELLTNGLGLVEAEVKDLMKQLKDWLEVHAKAVKMRNDLAALVKTQHDSLEKFNDPLRKLVRQVKNSPKATNEILADLHLLTTTSATSAAARTKAKAKTDKPTLKLTLGPDGVEVAFVKHGHGALDLYCRRGDETSFTLVAPTPAPTSATAAPTWCPPRPNTASTKASTRTATNPWASSATRPASPWPLMGSG